MTAASAAAVEAAQKELGCVREYGDLEYVANPEYCGEHYGSNGDHTYWTDRGCPVAVRVADAVVEAQG